MPGYTRLCPVMPRYVWLCSMMSRCRGCPATALRIESGPTLGLKRAAGSFDKWHHATAQDAHEKRTKFQAAPAASLAGHVGPRVDRSAASTALQRHIIDCIVNFFCFGMG